MQEMQRGNAPGNSQVADQATRFIDVGANFAHHVSNINKRAMALYTCVDLGNTIKVWLDFGSLWGFQTASDIKYDLRFEISDPNYLIIHVHIAYMV